MSRDRGYFARAYRDSFRPFGPVQTLPASGLHLLHRALPDGRHDLAGLYPYSCATNWAALPGDIADLRGSGAVAVSMVTDPFAEDPAQQATKDWQLQTPFKTHFIVDLAQDWRAGRSRNTRYYATRGLALQDMKVRDDPAAFAKPFWALYAAAAERLDMGALQRMSPQIIADHLTLAGAFLVTAHAGDRLTGAMITVQNGDTAYLHLMGMVPDAVKLHTSYALFHTALAHLEGLGCRYVSLGGAAGPRDDPEDGLYKFKKRWATETRRTWLVGAVLDAEAYDALNTQSGMPETGYFPAYRAPGSPLAWVPPQTDAL